jgi:L-lactate dehydrogenase (cytochrome)
VSRLARCRNVADLQRLARRRLPWPMREFLEGGADDEWTLLRNRAAYEGLALLPRVGVDVGRIDLATSALGQRLDWPVALAPTGMTRLYHPDGECGAARAAGRHGTLYALSTYSSQPLETVAEAATGPLMFQLFTSPGWELSLSLVDRAKAAGYAILCVTVDTTAPPNKERDLRTGLAAGGLSLRGALSLAARPRWVARLVRGGFPRLANFEVGARGAHALQWREADRLSWERIARLRERWQGPFVLKGVLRPDDAQRAAQLGVDAIIASNHGGRQLDTAAAPLDQLPDLVEAVGERLEVWIDSGIRRGSDVVKALALGARLCLVGRPYLYGIAAGGEAGVERAIEILRTELERDLKLLGAPRPADLDPSFVRPA